MKITESEVRINEVKVVVQAFSGVCFHERFARLLVMPWFVTGARLHGLEDVDQTRVSTTLLDDRLDTVVLSEGVALTYKFNLQSVFFGYPFGTLTKFFAQRVGPIRVVEDFMLF